MWLRMMLRGELRCARRLERNFDSGDTRERRTLGRRRLILGFLGGRGGWGLGLY